MENTHTLKYTSSHPLIQSQVFIVALEPKRYGKPLNSDLLALVIATSKVDFNMENMQSTTEKNKQVMMADTVYDRGHSLTLSRF